ncbi:uncharacterized protein LOC125438536 [Sphaerodactylus townsendi]|nr:uncharacterized protein LOC125438536 [Sphaerodactylus townsendi]
MGKPCQVSLLKRGGGSRAVCGSRLSFPLGLWFTLGSGGRGAEAHASGDLPHPLKMSVVDSQPSPFGRLTRERHIETVSRSPKKKQDFSEAVERSQDGATLSSHSTGIPRSQSRRVTQGGFARVCGSGEHSCHTDAWMHSEAVPCGIRHQGPLTSPPGWSRCKGGLRHTQQPGEEKQGRSYLGLQMLAGVRQLCITSTGELCGTPGNLARRGYLVSTADHERGLLVVTEGCRDARNTEKSLGSKKALDRRILRIKQKRGRRRPRPLRNTTEKPPAQPAKTFGR